MSGVPFIGFGALPSYKTPIIDFHGTQDDVIPYSVSSHGSYGSGPIGETSTVISYDGMYYLEKEPYIDFLGMYNHHFNHNLRIPIKTRSVVEIFSLIQQNTNIECPHFQFLHCVFGGNILEPKLIKEYT